MRSLEIQDGPSRTSGSIPWLATSPLGPIARPLYLSLGTILSHLTCATHPAHLALGYEAFIPDSPPMDMNIYSSLIEGIVAVLLVLWLAHACTFLPLALPFLPQVRSFSIRSRMNPPPTPPPNARALQFPHNTRQALAIGVALPIVVSFFMVEMFEKLAKKINKALSERFGIEGVGNKVNTLDPRLKLKAVAVATFATVVYLACFSEFYEVRLRSYVNFTIKVGYNHKYNFWRQS